MSSSMALYRAIDVKTIIKMRMVWVPWYPPWMPLGGCDKLSGIGAVARSATGLSYRACRCSCETVNLYLYPRCQGGGRVDSLLGQNPDRALSQGDDPRAMITETRVGQGSAYFERWTEQRILQLLSSSKARGTPRSLFSTVGDPGCNIHQRRRDRRCRVDEKEKLNTKPK